MLLFWLGAGPAGTEYLLHLEEGISNEGNTETDFLTGEPVILTGTVQKSQRAGREGYQTNLSYKLSDSTGSSKLNRTVSSAAVKRRKWRTSRLSM